MERRVGVSGRGWRILGGMNALVGIVLMLGIIVVLNLLAIQFPVRLQLSRLPRHRLGEQSLGLVERLSGDVRIIALLSEGARYHDDVLHLLREYVAAARTSDGLAIDLEIVDPRRDVGRTQALLREYRGLSQKEGEQEGTIIFDCSGRRKYVPLSDVIESETHLRDDRVLVQKVVGFRGEQVFSSALQSVVEAAVPRVCFLRGHGEKDPSSFDELSGYSEIGRLLERDNMDVRQLQATAEIPEDCSVLVIAGPKQKLSDREVRGIHSYLDRHGRLLLLQDPGVHSGLEALLSEWGVELGAGVVLDPRNTFSGQEVVIEDYPDHPAVAGMHGMISVFYLPRAVRPLDESAPKGVDRARVTRLANTTDHAWEEFSIGKQSPLRFDEGVDVAGRQSIAVACERGAVGVDLNLNPTRIVVVGDSSFVSNAALDGSVGGNAAFLMGVLNWLTERESHVSIASSPPSELHLEMDARTLAGAYARLALVLPGIILVVGALVARRRRT